MSEDLLMNNNNAIIAPIYDKIPLSHLLEAAVQKTYHELYTMADVLHSKSNLERKVELIKFACRARQLFIRVLAVVQWAASTGKVTVCEDIQNFLELRARLIRETSDSLAQLSREKLLDARVPNFPVTDAIDALTIGSVNFLPKRIVEITTSFIPATDSERQQILPRLQQILTSRISTSDLPIQFTDVIIKNGIVILGVDEEFEVKLGIINDSLTSPWQIYQTKLFLRDTEEPEQELVHPLQMQTLTNFIQSWLNDSEKPLVDLYQYLHYYCQALRLQILFEQAHRIRNQGAKQKDLIISNYTSCKSFNIEYWKEYSSNTNNNNNNNNNSTNQQRKPVPNGKNFDIGMTILCDEDGKFHIQHWPPLPVDDSVAVLEILKKSTFTMEEILNRTIYARCQRRFEELKETILSSTIANIEIDSSIPALKCEFVPECESEEILFISINPFSGLFKVVSYMETRYSQQIENALNRDQTNLIDSINLYKIWLIQQRIPSYLSHLNCRIYTQIPSLNSKHELIQSFNTNTIYIELIHNEGFYIVIYISDINQLLIQYYLLIIEKRNSIHEAFVTQQQTINSNDEGAKWILEPLLLTPLDPTVFLRKELFELKDLFPYNNQLIEDDNGIQQAQSMYVLSIKSLVKFINYYDEMLSLIILKEDFQRKKSLCKNILYCPWTGIPYLDIVRTSIIDDENELSSENELVSYIHEYFWPRVQSCTVRMAHTLRDTAREHKSVERSWILHLNLLDKNYFHNTLIKTPYNSFVVITSKSYSKIIENIHNELRSAYEITHLFENYSLSLLDSIDLHIISKIVSFNFFKCIISYGPNLSFSMILSYNSTRNSQELTSNLNSTYDLRFLTMNKTFLSTSHHLLNRKLSIFLNQTHSLKQFIRLLHMTTIPLASIARLNCFNRPIIFVNQGGCVQSVLTFVPYTESRWRLIFGQIFALDIQICGPNLILIRDGSFSVQLNSSLTEHPPIPKLKEFLSIYADDRGLTYEFSDIITHFQEDDFLIPEIQPFISAISDSNIIADDSSFMETAITSPSAIYDAIFQDPLPSASSNVRSDYIQQSPILHSYNRELLTKANYPVYMTQQTFFQMLYTPDKLQWSRLESFLASSILIRQFSKAVNEPVDANNPAVRLVPNEQDTYRIEHLSLQLSFDFHIPSGTYQIRLVSQSQSNIFWPQDELELFEKFINKNFFPLSSITNLVMPSIDILSLQSSQNSSTAMGSFQRMLSLIQPRLLKDLIRIIRTEQNPEMQHLWQVRWCLTIPQGNGFSQVGLPAIYYHSTRSSFLFMFQFTSRTNPNETPFIVPLLYDTINNLTTLYEVPSKHPIIGNEIKYQTIAKILTVFKETINQNECTLYQTILELTIRLQTPSTS